MAIDRLPPHRRLAAWLVTGPLGHLYGGLVDWASLLGRYAVARARGQRELPGPS